MPVQTLLDFDPHMATIYNRDRLDWLVVPVTNSRDATLLEKSNWCTANEILDAKDVWTTEIIRRGHLGVGWVEILIAHPSRLGDVEAIAKSLEDYPILSDTDLGEREWEAACDAWEAASIKERVKLCQDARINALAARRDTLPEDPQGALFERLTREC